MTREEAICRLEEGAPFSELYDETWEHALIMAIEALKAEPKWIPCNEKMPSVRDWYLGIFKETDTGWINPIPFICDYVGRDTGITTSDFWILKEHTDGREFGFNYYRNLTCVAWMPLPKPYEIDETKLYEVDVIWELQFIPKIKVGM